MPFSTFAGGPVLPIRLRMRAPKHARQQVRQILGDQAGPERRGGRAVQPHGGGRGEERLHALGEQAQDDTAEDIARAGGGQGRRRVGIDNCPAIRRGDHRIGAFQDDDGAAASGGGAGAGELVAARVEHAAKLAVMRRHDAGADNGPVERGWDRPERR